MALTFFVFFSLTRRCVYSPDRKPPVTAEALRKAGKRWTLDEHGPSNFVDLLVSGGVGSGKVKPAYDLASNVSAIGVGGQHFAKATVMDACSLSK